MIIARCYILLLESLPERSKCTRMLLWKMPVKGNGKRIRKAGRAIRSCAGLTLNEREREGKKMDWNVLKLLCGLRKAQKFHRGVIKPKSFGRISHFPGMFLPLPCSVIHWGLSRFWCWKRLKAKQKGTAEDEMVRQHHWLNGHGSEQTLGDSGGQRSLTCYSSWSHKGLGMT